MDFSAVNVAIVLVVYCIAEILKAFAIKNDKQRQLLPVICILAGAVISCFLYVVYPQGISCENFVDAVALGGMSGASAVGCNQIYKQYKKFSTGADE